MKFGGYRAPRYIVLLLAVALGAASFIALPIVTASSTTIDGYSAPGASANSNTTLAAGDNAVIEVVIDGTSAGDLSAERQRQHAVLRSGDERLLSAEPVCHVVDAKLSTCARYT